MTGRQASIEKAREAARDLGREAAHYVAREEWDDTAQDYLLPLDADGKVRCADNCKTCLADRALNDAIDSLASALAEAERQRDEAQAALEDEMQWDMGGIPESEWKARTLAAEAALADTRREADQMTSANKTSMDIAEQLANDYERVEQQLADTREALRKIEAERMSPMSDIARAALATPPAQEPA